MAADGSKVTMEIIVEAARLEVEIFIFCDVPTTFEREKARSVAAFYSSPVMLCCWLEIERSVYH